MSPPSGVTHAPADPRALCEAIRRSLLHRSRAGAREPQSGFPDGAGDGAAAGGVVQFLDKAADVPVVVPQLLSLVVETLLCRSSLGFVQFMDKVVDMPVGVQIFDKVADVPVVQARRWSRRAENCGVPQLQFSDKVDMPVVVNDRFSEVPQVQFLRLWTSL